MKYNRSEILANRMKWINFLMVKGRKKAVGYLDLGGGARCCLGHGCFVLGIKRIREPPLYLYDYEEELAPETFVEMVGLYDSNGSTGDGSSFEIDSEYYCTCLTTYNDEVNASPNEIGKYLLSVIEGGENTPFLPLTYYNEE